MKPENLSENPQRPTDVASGAMFGVTVGDGKYTVQQDASGRLTALRYGEPWRDCCGDGLIYTLAAELQESRETLAANVAEIKATWSAARDAHGQTEAFCILERMVDRLGYGRTENNPSLVTPNTALCRDSGNERGAQTK